MRMKITALFLFLTLIAIPSKAQAETAGAREAVEAFLKTIRAVESPAADLAAHEKSVAAANIYLDLEALNQKALGDHWAEMSDEAKKTFNDLMWKLIEFVAYPKSQKFMGDYEITYPEVKPTASGAEVHSVIKQQAEGLDAVVIYSLHQENQQWKVDDVVLDGVSITEDLKYQFDKLIEQSGFEGLLAKMRERLAQARKDAGLPE